MLHQRLVAFGDGSCIESLLAKLLKVTTFAELHDLICSKFCRDKAREGPVHSSCVQATDTNLRMNPLQLLLHDLVEGQCQQVFHEVGVLVKRPPSPPEFSHNSA